VPINLSTPVQHAVCSSTPGMSNHIGVDISAICRELCRPTIWLYPYHRSRGWTNSKIGNSLSNWSNRLLSTQTAEESSRRAYRRPICRWCEAPISPRRVQQRVPGNRHSQREQQLSKAVTPLPLVSLLATASTGSFHYCVSRDWSCLPGADRTLLALRRRCSVLRLAYRPPRGPHSRKVACLAPHYLATLAAAIAPEPTATHIHRHSRRLSIKAVSLFKVVPVGSPLHHAQSIS
jgi:hypothetical protein